MTLKSGEALKYPEYPQYPAYPVNAVAFSLNPESLIPLFLAACGLQLCEPLCPLSLCGKIMNKEQNKKLGAAIRERRKSLGMTQQLLSDSAGVNRSHLSLIETGEHHPSKRTMEEIARALQTTPENLEWVRDYLADLDDISNHQLYPGLRELLEDPSEVMLYSITEEEKRILKTIRLQWKNPSKKFFLQALLDYRRSREKRDI